MKKLLSRLSYPKIVALGFLFLIFIGAVLLSLPVSSSDGQATPFLSSLFTSTSATCVTGLVVFDTYAKWSVFGKAVILVLIQIGGLGFMSLMTMVSLILNRKISIKERTLLMDNYNTQGIGGMVRLTKRIVKWSFLLELAGALLLSIRFVPKMGALKGVFTSLFISVSAFCNAGFDLLGSFGEYSSLTYFSDDVLIIFTIAALIIIGGIGFIVWDDIIRHKFSFKHYSLHSKIALSTTAVLLIVPTILFMITEQNYTNSGLPVYKSLLNSFFDAVTPRTAGFNSVDTASLSDPSKILTVFLMMIGGSPGSTAGGIKTVTVAALIVSVFSNLRHKKGANIFRRRIAAESLENAICVITIYFSLLFAGVFVITLVQPALNMGDIVFECVSALSTVGMTTGITRSLETVPKIIIILLMYGGRIGSLSFALLFTQNKQKSLLVSPEEKIGIG